jgi:RimJ/RimL family protein N-acetyltransferase
MPLARRVRQKRAMPQYEIRTISRGSEVRKIGAKAQMDYINRFVDEKAYISVQKKVTLDEEKAFVEKNAKAMDEGDLIRLALFVEGKYAGGCDIRKAAPLNMKHNVHFGLSVAKEWRGFGFGEMLLRKGIEVARKKFKAHKMWIEHDSENMVAARLYRKVGFVRVARLRDYCSHYGKYTDNCLMEYRGD